MLQWATGNDDECVIKILRPVKKKVKLIYFLLLLLD
jgi:hypothetical protein